MKKFYYIVSLLLCMSSCEDYLSFAPDSGLSQEEVFSNYQNITSYFNPVYSNIKDDFPLYLDFVNFKQSLYSFTEFFDQERAGRPCHSFKKGIFGPLVNNYMNSTAPKSRAIWTKSWADIRICNVVLENIDNVKDFEEVEKADLIGQAIFYRAYSHFSMIRYWGGIPYLRKPLSSSEPADLPRLSLKDSYLEVAKDCDDAYKVFSDAGLVRRDGGPGSSDYLRNSKQSIPAGMVALALKSRTLLYAASPLSNVDNDVKLWEDAASAAWEAIKVAKQYQYELLPKDEWHTNTYGADYTNESFWTYDHATLNANSMGTGIMSGVMTSSRTTGAAGLCPTQNFVDRFETSDGFSLLTESDRNIAIKNGSYSDQNPYANRDPRLSEDVYYNTAPIIWKPRDANSIANQINIWYMKKDDKIIYGDHISDKQANVTVTGYLQKRLSGDMTADNGKSYLIADPLFRMAELYLNYAEAANEVGGPNAKIGGASITALQAINIIRNRMDMPPVRDEYTTSKDIFRERIQNERIVELALEGHHYYFDSRRWRIAEKYMKQGITVMDVERLPEGASEDYPTGYRYTRRPIDDVRNCTWYDKMYYWPFVSDMYYQFKTFDTSLNPYW